MSYRKILLVVDPSMQVTPAFRRAERLARATGATLHLCLFDHSRAVRALAVVSAKVGEVLKSDLIKERELWLRKRVQSLRAAGVKAHAAVTWGTPVHQHVLDKVAEIQPDLVVKDVHLEPLLKRVLFAPLDWQLLRLCPVPLLMVRGGGRKPPRRIIAAVDTAHLLPGSDSLNDEIVRRAEELALQCKATVDLVHCFEDLVPVAPAEVMSAEAFGDACEELRQIHRKRFEDFADTHDIHKVHRHFLYGPPAFSLTEFTDHPHGDVLVLGTTHRTGLERLLIGSTAESILADLRCDILAVKPSVPRKPSADARKRAAVRAPRENAEPLSLG